ncbi:unnamed protein product [marine sediment metagenome]|uniref:Uncharacterized protein n=1 Tax=marine sediment metagenome TaxID=412755 RepID=X1G667_9ZZZZ
MDYQKGTYHNPLSGEELKTKFNMCVEGKFSAEYREQLAGTIEQLQKVDDISEIQFYEKKK